MLTGAGWLRCAVFLQQFQGCKDIRHQQVGSLECFHRNTLPGENTDAQGCFPQHFSVICALPHRYHMLRSQAAHVFSLLASFFAGWMRTACKPNCWSIRYCRPCVSAVKRWMVSLSRRLRMRRASPSGSCPSVASVPLTSLTRCSSCSPLCQEC